MRTLKEIRDKVIDDLDLYEETFVDEPEIDQFINEGIKKAESNIHTLYEDYFLSTYTISITPSEYLYDYPSDIYANKVRMIIFQDGNDAYEVKRAINVKENLLYEKVAQPTSGCTLKWYPINTASDGRKIRIFPNTSDTGTLEIWYIRNAAQLVNDGDVCDIDEFSTLVELHAKTQILLKDGDPRAADMALLEQKEGERMVNSLSDMVQDDDNEIFQDLSHYEESI